MLVKLTPRKVPYLRRDANSQLPFLPFAMTILNTVINLISAVNNNNNNNYNNNINNNNDNNMNTNVNHVMSIFVCTAKFRKGLAQSKSLTFSSGSKHFSHTDKPSLNNLTESSRMSPRKKSINCFSKSLIDVKPQSDVTIR
jgi:hypothetical protein